MAETKRREFITPLGGAANRRDLVAMLVTAAALAPVGASAEALSRRPTIGFLGGGAKAANRQFYDSFPQGLRDLGYVDGRDYAFAERYADGDLGRLPVLAQELVRLAPHVIVAAPGAAVAAARQATADIPIVGINMNDPVGMGLAASEARPGSNVRPRYGAATISGTPPSWLATTGVPVANASSSTMG